MNYAAFVKALSAFDHVALTAPGASDGDSVGTQCALLELLQRKFPKKRWRVINEDPCPRRHLFIPLTKRFEVAADVTSQKREKWPDAIVCVDGGSGRLGTEMTKLWAAVRGKGQIDHHAVQGTQESYQFRLYNPKAAATTEIVYKLAKARKWKITPTVAQSIYLGLVHDTGMFKHSNTTPEILCITAELLKTGFNHTETAEKGLLIRSESNLKMLREMIAHLHFDLGGRYVWGCIDHTAFMASGGDSDEREGLIDVMFLTDKCEIAALYLEIKPQVWRISFRSRGWNVAELARSLAPSGGGHKQAAGVNLDGTQTDVLNRSTQKIKALLK